MKRLHEILIAIGLMASLLAGSVSACSCSHHQVEAAHTTSSCHEMMADDGASPLTHQAAGKALDVPCDCGADNAASFAIVKSENRKTKPNGDAAAFPSLPSVSLVCSDTPCALVAIQFSRPQYLGSNSRILLPSRAPPRL